MSRLYLDPTPFLISPRPVKCVFETGSHDLKYWSEQISGRCISLNYSKRVVMKMKLAILIMLLSVFAMPAVADDVDKWVRQNAAEALGMLNDTRAVEPLKSALNDEDEDVQEASEDSLKNLGWQAP
jgi:hypothetical protein